MSETNATVVLKRLQEMPLSLITRAGEEYSSLCSSQEDSPQSGRHTVMSLGAASQSAVIESLGKIATGRFSCGGTLQSPHTVQLTYLKKSGEWSGVTFPDLNDTNFEELLESSSVASFGRGKEMVTDRSIRDANVMEPGNFLTSFQLSNVSILREIQMLLAPDVMDICAELYKMNIYTSPTGCFKVLHEEIICLALWLCVCPQNLKEELLSLGITVKK